jgi:acyl-coenzyme A synthetase/AMP-(fatty) acid ligase
VLPVTLEDLGKDPASLELVSKKLRHLYFAGGSVPQAAGNLVASKIPVYQTTGSTEASLLTQIRSWDNDNKENWSYIQIHPAINAEFRHHHGDLYEMAIVRSSENEEYQPVFLHFPNQKEYETRDLLSSHPSLPGLWRYRGRKDDIIVFLNGEKTNPVSFEQDVSRHPEVRSAIVAGAQRFEACLLVELLKAEPLSADERAQVIERIWPTVQKANSQCPAHARVSKSSILITDPSKPMARAAKGTVQRAATLILYSEEIDTLYADNEFNLSSGLASIDLNNPDAVTEKVHELVARRHSVG